MKKRTKISLIVTSCVICLIFVACMIYYFGASHKNFYAVATEEFEIPGLNTTFVPQGMDYDEESQKFLVSGYMSNESASRFYIVDKESGKAEKYFTLTVEDEAYTGHAGGIAIDGDYAWTCGEGFVYRFDYEDALALEDGASLEVIDGFETNNGADFLYEHNDHLIVGEFYKEDKYETPESHHLKISDSEINKALCFAYVIDQSKPYGLSATIPEYGISMPNQVQGMCLNAEGEIILSTSYSLPDSIILTYENVWASEPTETMIVDNLELPVYVLCEDNLLASLEAPCMSEEMALVDGKVLVLFENKCSKYKWFTRTRLSNVYALDI